MALNSFKLIISYRFIQSLCTWRRKSDIKQTKRLVDIQSYISTYYEYTSNIYRGALNLHSGELNQNFVASCIIGRKIYNQKASTNTRKRGDAAKNNMSFERPKQSQPQ